MQVASLMFNKSIQIMNQTMSFNPYSRRESDYFLVLFHIGLGVLKKAWVKRESTPINMAGESLLMSNSEYIQNQTKFYSDLLESQELTDVTLACDGYQVGAHRTVISASSLFFRDVIKNSKHQNPFIYLKGVSKETLESMLHFIYAGEATVQSENLEQLVEVGKDLEVIGLMQEKAKALEKKQSKDN